MSDLPRVAEIVRTTRETDIRLSVSYTTRPPRPGEIDGVDYHFVDLERFRAMVANHEFLEWAHVFGHRYGTPKAQVWNVLEQGRVGETYNIGGGNQQANIDVVHMLCDLLDELVPDSPHKPHSQLIRFVQDRPGHDRRYAIDARKLEGELGWRARETFATGLRKTVQWYLNNRPWIEEVTSGAYQNWVHANYGHRGEEANALSAPAGAL